MTKEDRIDLLSGVPLFAGLDDRSLKALAGVVREESFAAGDVIVREGDAGGALYVIVQGRAGVIVGGEERSTIGPGGMFGEISVIDGSERSATVRAETRVLALSISSVSFVALLQEEWTICKRVLDELCLRVRKLDRSMVS